MGSPTTQNLILLLGLLVQIATLCFLIVYVRATIGIQKAAMDQTKASRDLAQWQRRQWELDNRKEEWREVIQILTTCFPKIESLRATAPSVFATATPQWVARQEDARWALLEAWGAVNSRLFITDVLEKENVKEGWREIELMSDRPAAGGAAGMAELQQKWVVFHRKLVRAAQADLGIPFDGRDTAHG